MKQRFLLITLLLSIFLAIPVFSDENIANIEPDKDEIMAEEIKPLVIPPKWTDFCETGYENAVYKDSHDLFNVFSFVKSERIKKKYWAERRVSFEKYLKSCNALSDEAKATCYAELKKSEEQKNDLYKLQRKQLLYESNVDIHRR